MNNDLNTQEIQSELDKLETFKKEIDDNLKLGVDAYADEIKNRLGEEIKKELQHPTNHPIPLKKSFWVRLKEWWANLKTKLYNYFFN